MTQPAERSSPWSSPVSDVVSGLSSDIKKGLGEEAARRRRTSVGKNVFQRVEAPSVAGIFLRQLKSPLVIVLLFAVIATIVLQEWLDAVIIFLAVGINIGLGFYQEYKAERAIADLRSFIQERTRVVRDGNEREIDAALLVPGDIIHISQGMRVPADARIIHTKNFFIDESILTGESLPVEKQTAPVSEAAVLAERTNMVFGGTLVVDGGAQAVVTTIGGNTEIGKLADLVARTPHQNTPLQNAVASLAWIIVIGLSIVVAGLFAIGVARGEGMFDMLLISIAVVVGAVPEALPIGLTAVLAVGVERIAKRRGIMRSLTAAETLGSTTVIMTDKTGTMTEAKMKLVDIVLSETLAAKKPYRYAPRRRFSSEQKNLLAFALINTDVVIENPDDDPEAWHMSGHALEVNIVRAAALHGIAVFAKGVRDASQITLPFNSVHKFSVAKADTVRVASLVQDSAGPYLAVLGAPDILLARSKLEKDAYLAMQQRIEEMSEHGRRLLGVAVMPAEGVSDTIKPEHVQNLTFLGVIGFHDPVRKEVPETLKHIERYGVRIIMATGDLKGTALAVARDIGWRVDAGEVLTGEELRQLDDATLLDSLGRIRIFARVTPEDKLRVATLLKARGEVVAMTGDGVNDAPSLRAASIGIAVGSGSDVAKSVADLVLLDDNFSTIVSAIEEGRRMLRNIKKIFVYLMSNSLDEVVLIGGALLTGIALPLSALQIIWVNLFTGGLPAIAFAFDRDTDLEDSRKDTKTIFDNEVRFLTLCIGLLTSVLLFILYYILVASSIPLSTAQSVLFVCFASYVLVIAFSFRNLHRPIFSYSLFENKLLVAGIALGLALLAATMYVPAFQQIFGTTALHPVWLLLVVGWLALNLALVEGAKWLFYRDRTGSSVGKSAT